MPQYNEVRGQLLGATAVPDVTEKPSGGTKLSRTLLDKVQECGVLVSGWSLFLGTCVPQTITGCLTGEEGHLAFQRILDKVRDESLDVQSVVSLLQLCQDSNPAVKAALSGRKPEDEEVVQPKGRSKPAHPSHWVLCQADAMKFAPVIHFFSGLVIVKWSSHTSFRKLQVKYIQAKFESPFQSPG